MKIVYIIFGGWYFWLVFTIWGLILGLFGAQLSSSSLKGMAGYITNPTEVKFTKGELGDNLILNILFIFMGIGFLVHSFIWGFILGLFDKDLGAALKDNAMAGLSLCANKFDAAPAAE